jgi:putative Mg2+ transporter-C (MgtC) family protein
MIWSLLLSVFLGFLIGIERESKHKSVGIRTLSLITLGSTIYTLISIYHFSADPTRVIAQIVSGIGFLGAGIIFKSGNSIIGLTTAATVWTSSAIGVLVGLGLYQLAFVSTILILIINTLFKYFKNEDS